jgi:hypothetical protein
VNLLEETTVSLNEQQPDGPKKVIFTVQALISSLILGDQYLEEFQYSCDQSIGYAKSPFDKTSPDGALCLDTLMECFKKKSDPKDSTIKKIKEQEWEKKHSSLTKAQENLKKAYSALYPDRDVINIYLETANNKPKDPWASPSQSSTTSLLKPKGTSEADSFIFYAIVAVLSFLDVKSERSKRFSAPTVEQAIIFLKEFSEKLHKTTGLIPKWGNQDSDGVPYLDEHSMLRQERGFRKEFMKLEMPFGIGYGIERGWNRLPENKKKHEDKEFIRL